MRGGRTTAAVYLAGYAVECMLKALILERCPAGRHATVLASFKGAKAHDFDWPRSQYLGRGATPFPRRIARRFAMINTWTTAIRYHPARIKPSNAKVFLQAVDEILAWADNRI